MAKNDEFIIQNFDDDDIEENGLLRLREWTVHCKGNWRVHKSDVDNWPSNLHAHSLEVAEKMDLYTGEIYDVKSHELVRKLRPKELRNVHSQLRDAGVTWAVAKLAAKEEATKEKEKAAKQEGL